MSSSTTTRDVHSKTAQSKFVEESIREGWSMADVTMWQQLCRRLALLAPGTESIMYVLLAISEEQGISPLGLCHAARDQGHKVVDEKAIDTLCHIYGTEADERAEAMFDEIHSDDDRLSIKEPKAKRRLAFIDLTEEHDADDDVDDKEVECEEDSEKTIEIPATQPYDDDF